MNASIDSKTLKDIKEHGEHIGICAQYLKSIGATDEQIKWYVERSYPTMPVEYVPIFLASARKSYATKSNKFDHPIYNLFKSRLADTVKYWNSQGG